MISSRASATLVPVAAAAFAAAFIAFEHFTGGVQTHHFLGRGDLPGFSNWLSLLVLPLLGIVVAVRIRRLRTGHVGKSLWPGFSAGIAGSLCYGAALASGFLLGLDSVSLVLFAGLLPISIALPVYRAECIFGFVAGMTIAFGSVIPLTFAVVFATLSFVVRRIALLVWSALRGRRS